MTGGKSLKTRIYQRKSEGTITVFLSLVLLLILSLLCTIIEGARVSTAKVYAERALTTAMDSVLAEYYGPLWEEYHIFGYYTGDEVDSVRKGKITEAVSEYMSYTFTPDKNPEGQPAESSIELYDIMPENISINDETDLMDYEGELLINEAVEYMKYREIGDGIETLLDKLNLLETPDKVSYIMQEKQKVEEELVEIDMEKLQLMELFDGLMTNEKGIELAKDGSLKMTSSFIKKICYANVTMESVGINQESIYLAQKDNYVNPAIHFTRIEDSFSSIEQTLSQIEAIQAELELTEFELADQQAALAVLNAIEDKTDEDKQQIKETKKTIKGLQSSIEERESQVQEQRKSMNPLVSLIKTESSRVTHLIEEIKPLINSAILSVDKILVKIDTAAPLIKQYEDLLTSQKEILSEDIYKGLEEELKELKKYTAAEGGYDFAGMKTILENNLTILTNTQDALEIAEEELDTAAGSSSTAAYTSSTAAGSSPAAADSNFVEAFSSSKTAFENAENILKAYQIHGLTLDYSTLKYDKSSQKTPLKEVNNVLQSGLTSLVLDPNSISDLKLLTSELLPSQLHAMSEEKADFITQISSFFENSIIGGSNSGIGDLFGSFTEGTQMNAAIGEGMNELAELILFQEYQKEHFGRYQPQGEEKGVLKPSVLKYEQEYLLTGKISDQENLASVISRLVFLRMIFDFVSVLSNSTIRNEAKLIAASLVGFTGLPILVSITQALILLLWSFAEALLDTSALMMGKEMPILKKNIVLKFPEIFLLNREFLGQKASALTDTKELSFSYQDYLRVFLLMKSKEDIAYRSMDLMQENIRLRYDVDNFKIGNCLFGFEIKEDFIVKSKFTGFSFLKSYLNINADGFRFTAGAAYSY